MTALILFLLSLIPTDQVTWYTTPPEGLRVHDMYGTERYVEGAVDCIDGHAIVWLSATASESTVAHELAHVYDCVDNGVLDGSPSVRPDTQPVWASDYCWQHPVEWHACEMVRKYGWG